MPNILSVSKAGALALLKHYIPCRYFGMGNTVTIRVHPCLSVVAFVKHQVQE